MAVIVGGALAAAGTVLQALLRNPLAEPHLLGVSGGAAFGGRRGADRSAVPAASCRRCWCRSAAFAGALLAMLIVYRLGTVHGRLQPYTFLLAGVVCNAFTGALIMALNALADFFQAHGILFWLMGSLQTQSYWLVRGERAVCRRRACVWLLRHARELQRAQPRRGERGAARRGRRPDAARGVRRLLAAGRRRGVGERHDRLRRPDRARTSRGC